MYKQKYLSKWLYLLVIIILVIPSLNINSLNVLNDNKSSNSTAINQINPDIYSLTLSRQSISSTNTKLKTKSFQKSNKSNNISSVQSLDSIQSLNTYNQINCAQNVGIDVYCVYINGNSQFNQTGSIFTGNGTKSNPYLLANNAFTTNYFTTFIPIFISNTNAYFEIINNTVSVASAYFVELTNVSNGIIANNTVQYSYNPIFIKGPSSNISVINDTIIGTPTEGNGIWFQSISGSVTVLNNTVKNFGGIGIYFQGGGPNNSIENNTVTNNVLNGIFIGAQYTTSESTYNSTIKNNMLTNNYIYFETDYAYNTTPIYQFDVSNNFVNNRPVDFFQFANNPFFSSNPGEIVVFNCTNVDIQNLPTMSGPFIISRSKNVLVSNISIINSINPGMDLYNDSNILVTNNLIKNDSIVGINLSSKNATAINNFITGFQSYSVKSSNGIVIGVDSISGNISFNTISNFQMGIYVYSNNVTINNNIIKNITANAVTLYGYSITKVYSISNNQFFNYSISPLSDFYTKFLFNNNTFDDAPIVIYNGLQNQVIAPNGTIPSVIGQLFIEDSNQIVLKNIKVDFDLTLSNCANVTVTNTTTLINGVTISASGNLTFTNNLVYSQYYGLHISATSNLYALIANNTVLDNFSGGSIGMFLVGISNSIVKNNSVSNFSHDIDLSSVVNSLITNNLINYIGSGGIYGFYLTYSCQYNKIANNTVSHFSNGIYLNIEIYSQLSYNEIYNNTLTNNGYGVYVNQVSNNSIFNNFFQNNGYGFYLNYAHFTTVSNNTIQNNSYGGYLYSSSGNDTISGNRITNSSYYGLYIDSTSNNNTIINNIFANNSQEALRVYSIKNYISLNDFVYNNQSTFLNHNIQVYIGVTNNIITGNYYSDALNYDFNWDGIADTPYSNFGKILVDPFPSANPLHLPDTIAPTIFISPATNSIFGGEGFLLKYNISESSITKIYINNLVNTTDIPSGTNMSYLGGGTYNITIKVTDLAGNIGITTIIVTIKTFELSLIVINPSNTTYSSQSINVSYTINASYSYSLTVYINGNKNISTLYNNSFWQFSEGYNNLTLVLTDLNGHVNTTSIFFSIDTTPPVVTILSPSNTTYTQNYLLVNYTISDYSNYTTVIYMDGMINNSIVPNSYVTFTDGYHNLTIAATDSAGHSTIVSFYFTIHIPPTVVISSITNTTYNINTLQLNYETTHANKVVIYIDNNLNASITNGSILTFTDGYHNITVIVTNIYGQKASFTVVFLISTAPNTSSTNPPNSSTSPKSTSSSQSSGSSQSQTQSSVNSQSTNTTSNSNTHATPISLFSILLAILLISTLKIIYSRKKRLP